MVIQPDGKMVVGGYTDTVTYLAHFHPDGLLDYSFNQKGYIMEDLSPENLETIEGLTIDNNNRLVYCGTLHKGSTYLPYVGRVHLGQISTGMEDMPLVGAVNIYPNPAREKTWVAFHLEKPGNVCLTLTDMAGRILAMRSISLESTGAQTINISSWLAKLPSSIYSITISAGGQSATRQLMIP